MHKECLANKAKDEEKYKDLYLDEAEIALIKNQ